MERCCSVAGLGDVSTWSKVFATYHHWRAGHIDEPAERRVQPMEVLHPIVAGMDVHRDTVVITILKALPDHRTWKETKTFQTFPDQLRVMLAWLDEHGVPIVAMESTGVYWKPIYRVLQSHAPGRVT
jgi:hypothetical protein